MSENRQTASSLADLLVTSKDGDWGKGEPTEGHLPYLVIRGTDFERVRVGNLSTIPLRYLPERTVERRTLLPDDILIETAGGTPERPTGRTMRVTGRLLDQLSFPATCASFARFLRVDRGKADPNYLFWHLQNEYAQGRMRDFEVRHTGVGRFQYTEYSKRHEVFLPPLSEQRRIAAVLSSLDDLIEHNRAQIEAVRSLSGALYDTFAQDVDELQPLGEVASVSQTKVKPGLGTIRYIDIAAMGDGTVEWSSPVDWTDAPSRARVGASDGATLWSTVRPNRRAHALLWTVPAGVVLSTGIAVLQPYGVGPAELFAATDRDDFVAQLVSMADGSAYPAVRPKQFEEVLVPRLSSEESARFEAALGPLWSDVDAAQCEIDALTRTRDELLPLLMSGAIRVDEALEVSA